MHSPLDPEKRNRIALGAGLFVIVLAVFWKALGNDFINYDDPHYVTENVHVRGGLSWENIIWAFASSHGGNWHPVTWLSHMFDCQLFGLEPWGHHLTSVVLHAVNAALVFLLLYGATRAKWRSLFVAAIFGLHPLRVESVAWAAERKDVLSSFFWLLTLWAYVRYAGARPSRAPETKQKALAPGATTRAGSAGMYYALALVFFALGLMSKPMLVTLPFVLLLLDYWPLDRFALNDRRSLTASTGRALREKLPFFALAAAASAVTFFVQKQAGAMEAMEAIPFPSRLANSAISYCRYLGKLFDPLNLAVFYPYPDHWPLAAVILAFAFLTACTILVIVHGRKYPYLPVGWFWFLGTLIPVIGLVQVGAQALADRYTYIPLLGILVICAWGLADLSHRWRYRRFALTAAASVSILLCLPLTIRQIAFWKDSETLFRHALAVTGNNTVALLNLGVGLMQRNRPAEAVAPFRSALTCSPNEPRAHLDLATALSAIGLAPEAIMHYRIGLRFQPDLTDPRLRLAELLAKQGQLDEAATELHRELAVAPTDANGRVLLASILRRQGRIDEAIQQYETVLKTEPENFDAHNNLGIAFYQKGRLDQAVGQFRQAVRLQPNLPDGHSNLALAVTSQGAIDEAIAEYQQVLKLQPGSALARKKLEALLAKKGGAAAH